MFIQRVNTKRALGYWRCVAGRTELASSSVMRSARKPQGGAVDGLDGLIGVLAALGRGVGVVGGLGRECDVSVAFWLEVSSELTSTERAAAAGDIAIRVRYSTPRPRARGLKYSRQAICRIEF